MKPGDRVQLSEAGRAAGLTPKAGIRTVVAVSDAGGCGGAPGVDVRLDGQTHASWWASDFWEPAAQVPTSKIYL